MTDDPTRTGAVRPAPDGPIRVAVRADRTTLAAADAAAIERVGSIVGVDIVLFLLVPGGRRAGGHSLRGRVLRGLGAAFGWLEDRVLRGGPSAIAPVALPAPLRHVRRVATGSAAAAAAALVDSRAAVLLDLAGDGAMDAPLPPSGRWRVRHVVEDGPAQGRVTRPAASHALVGSALAIDLPSGEGREAFRSTGALHREGFGRSRDALGWRTAAFFARGLERLVDDRGLAAWTVTSTVPVASARRRLDESPPLPPVLPFVAAVARRVVDRIAFETSWAVLVHDRDPGAAPPADLRGFQPLAAPAGRFYADPFLIEERGAPRLYVEDCPTGVHRGRISRLGRQTDGAWSVEATILDDIAHRSYPHVIGTSVGLVMTPDGGRTGGVDVFMSNGDGTWSPTARILDGVAASDPTLIEHDGSFWLFVAVTGPGMDPWDELHLYSATALTGPWAAHPRNPVVADVRRARPAGRIFRMGATMVRPGQDCSVAYGRRIVLSAIDTLTTTDYEEHPIAAIEPSGQAGIVRTHTYTFDGSVEALDGYRRRPRLRWGRGVGSG